MHGSLIFKEHFESCTIYPSSIFKSICGLMPLMDSSLTPFFSPRGIVVIGASTLSEKLGFGVARNLTHCGYQGAIHFVSQKQGELFGRPVYTEVNQVTNPADLAILIVPPDATPKTIQECGQRGIKAAIIMS